ncbi:MAG TPA: M3 family metallopeptidase [Thermoanaerobaculia bacterium]|nr:M3 family metallopeptidase [Thermoanaerobaculia bacterium]
MILAAAIAIAACTTTTKNDVTMPTATESTPAPVAETTQPSPPAPAETNPLLASWSGPYGGVPPFDQVKVEHFKPALEAAMAENLAEVDRIAADPAAPTFENTIAALEKTGRTLDRVGAAFGVWSSTMSDDAFQPVELEMAPKLAEFSDKITQNEALFRRIETVYNSPDKARLTPEQQRLAWLYYTNFVRAGAKLDADAKKRVAAINQQLAELYTKFGQNVLADEKDRYVTLDSEADLAGLPQSVRNGAAAAAKSKNLEGKWVISNTRSAIEPFLTYSDRRDLREKAWRMFVNRGDNGDAHDNNALITDILRLRAERAKLLGYKTHAHWRLENTMAKTPERALELMEAVWPPAVARVREEVRDMQAVADKEKANIRIEPWDYRYYAEKVRKAKYDLDQNEVKQYLQLDKLRDAIHWVAGELFNFNFTPVDVPVYHPDVKVWEVTDKTSGKHIGLWYFDPYARAGKQSGAWMNAYRSQQRFDTDITTIVSNNSNFVKGAPGEPLLISWEDATTMFHEFGHALHGLSSNVNYPSLSGTAVFRDYVEFPSQLLEHWLSTPEVLQRFAVNVKGEPIPQKLVDRIKKAATFNEGFRTVEYLSSAIVDMRLHLAGDTPIDPDAFEKQTLAELGMPKEIVMRHRTPQFLHVFAGDGYSAGYYSYLWSDVLTADAAEAFDEAPNGFYDANVAQQLRRNIFSVGNTLDPAEGFRAFRGRDPEIDALMRKRGFPVPPRERMKKQ